MFFPGRTISLNRVRDRITVKEGDETLVLDVDSDARLIVTRIRNAQEQLILAEKQNADQKTREHAVRAFSEAIFGKDETDSLIRFYHGDYACVLAICGMYFEKRLCKRITKAQKKLK